MTEAELVAGSMVDLEAAAVAEDEARQASADIETLRRMGYKQELARRLSAFSNFAISFAVICILSGCVTSLHLGLCATGGAAIGIGWAVSCLFSMAVAASMAQLASAFPTCGGLYHWASMLGGRGCGWATAWFNLAGLITATASVNAGCALFLLNTVGPTIGGDADPAGWSEGQRVMARGLLVAAITLSQAGFNHRGIRLTSRLIDASGYLILFVTMTLTVALLAYAPSWDWSRLVTFSNFSGLPAEAPVWPRTDNLAWLFVLGLLLPAYTITCFDASAHAAEETVGAAEAVPRGIMRSVWVSCLFGWIMLSALVLAMPSLAEAVEHGEGAFAWTIAKIMPRGLALAFFAGIAVAQYLCGLAAVTSTSRMAFAFARDGGLPFGNAWVRRVSPRFATPSVAIWTTSTAAIAFTVSTRVYSSIVSVCIIFIYLSYIIPISAGLLAHGRTWTAMGPWTVGRWFKPLATLSVLGGLLLIAAGIAPPNDTAAYRVVGGGIAALALAWVLVERKRFKGPPLMDMLDHTRASDA
ncbi:amino acid permease [Isosphaeraceae bacterium EP7]